MGSPADIAMAMPQSAADVKIENVSDRVLSFSGNKKKRFGFLSNDLGQNDFLTQAVVVIVVLAVAVGLFLFARNMAIGG